MPNLMSKIVSRKPNLLACQGSSLIAPLGNNYLERGFRSRVKKRVKEQTQRSGV